MRVQAYAKINLTLEVLGRRDDGYHQVKTILQTIDLADLLDIEPANTLRVDCDDPDLRGDANLVSKAARALAQQGGVDIGARIFIRKRIPVGMGLGGGSSDAAAALVALNRLWDLGFGVDELVAVAAGLGSDVPFFLYGGTALAEGRGEEVSPLPPLAPVPIMMVCPYQTLPEKTKQLYARITPAQYSDGGVTRRMVQTLIGGQFVVDDVHNVFQDLALQVFPGLKELCQVISEVTGQRPHLAGSGPALFCLPTTATAVDFELLSKALRTHNAEAYLTHAIMPPSKIK